MTRSKRQTVMDEKDRKFIQDVKDDYSGRHMTEQAPEQRLLKIIDRLEDECQIREYQKNAWQRETTSLKTNLEEAKSDAKKECRRALLLSKQCDSLEDQLQTLKKVVEPFKRMADLIIGVPCRSELSIDAPNPQSDFEVSITLFTGQREPQYSEEAEIKEADFRALAEKLDEVEDG